MRVSEINRSLEVLETARRPLATYSRLHEPSRSARALENFHRQHEAGSALRRMMDINKSLFGDALKTARAGRDAASIMLSERNELTRGTARATGQLKATGFLANYKHPLGTSAISAKRRAEGLARIGLGAADTTNLPGTIRNAHSIDPSLPGFHDALKATAFGAGPTSRLGVQMGDLHRQVGMEVLGALGPGASARLASFGAEPMNRYRPLSFQTTIRLTATEKHLLRMAGFRVQGAIGTGRLEAAGLASGSPSLRRSGLRNYGRLAGMFDSNFAAMDAGRAGIASYNFDRYSEMLGSATGLSASVRGALEPIWPEVSVPSTPLPDVDAGYPAPAEMPAQGASAPETVAAAQEADPADVPATAPAIEVPESGAFIGLLADNGWWVDARRWEAAPAIAREELAWVRDGAILNAVTLSWAAGRMFASTFEGGEVMMFLLALGVAWHSINGLRLAVVKFDQPR